MGVQSGLTGFAGAASPLGFNEVYRINNPSANSGRVTAIYWDIPAETYTLVRANITTAPVTIIPAPAANYYSQFAMFNTASFTTLSGVTSFPRYAMRNGDGITHNLELFIGGTIFQRNSVTATNIALGIPLFRNIVTNASGALTIGLAEAVSTTPPVFAGCYRTLPL